ncbi:ATP-dependent RNA helicase SUPV3L1/SUV3 [Constrictibacter sp. MBR-5]
MYGSPARSRVTAVLGPTNTGKTYLAVERMLGHRSGMIGFPLRLLARENYDRIVAVKGAGKVALVTGEEKIVPPNPSWFVCTVESMPLDRPVAFLAVDEIQMAADPERGHVFTERLLHARGLEETMFLGADTARPLIRALVPGVEFIARPRFSSLTYTGPQKVTRLPPRSAVVAFSVAEVYRIAELVRRQRGGTAVVLGALSPRARNAQVAMYQEGEVDYLVATDAIGMGLNMDVRHVAFSALRKFDGRNPRPLTSGEVAQIAGRAGRHMNDGTFGTTAEVPGMDPELVQSIEEHSFEPLPSLFWRNASLDFSSLKALANSLEIRPPHPGLIRAREGEDQEVLATLSRDEEIARVATTRDRIGLLWDVCQVPDFRKTLTDGHARLLGQIYKHLVSPQGRLPADFVADQIERLDRTEGDIDALMARIAATRTWTYVSHRAGWLENPAEWQERSRAIEDRLSDALHERLTHRFVDKRAATLVRRLRDGGELLGAVTLAGTVLVEGEQVGCMTGFRFEPEAVGVGEDAKPLMAAAQRVLRGDIGARVARFAAVPDAELGLDPEGRILWQGAPVARLLPGTSPLSPRVETLPEELLEAHHREQIRTRCEAWLNETLRRRIGALLHLRDTVEGDSSVGGAVRGLAFQLGEWLGVVPRAAVRDQVAALTPEERKRLAALGLRIGIDSVWLQPLLNRRAARTRLLLWAIAAGRAADPALPAPPPDKAGWMAVEDDTLPPQAWAALGMRRVGSMAVRVDRLERLTAMLRAAARQGPFAATDAMAAAIGCPLAALEAALPALGYSARTQEDGTTVHAAERTERKRPPRRRRKPQETAAASTAPSAETPAEEPPVRAAKPRPPRPERPHSARRDPEDSPFARLRELTFRE